MKLYDSEIEDIYDFASVVQTELLNIPWKRFREYNKHSIRLTNLPITGGNISFNVARNIRFEVDDEYFNIYFVKPYEGASSWVKLYSFKPDSRWLSTFYNAKYNEVVLKQLKSVLEFILEAKEQFAEEDKEEQEENELEMDRILLGEQ